MNTEFISVKRRKPCLISMHDEVRQSVARAVRPQPEPDPYLPVLHTSQSNKKSKDLEQSKDLDKKEIKFEDTLELFVHYPLSSAFALRKTFVFFMTWLALVGAFFVITNYTDLLPVDSILLTKKRYLLGFFGIVLLAQYVYAELYRAKLKYCIKSFRFVVSRGVFFPKLGSLPISIMAETYIRRNVIDILCGVCSFQIHTALDPTKSFLKIEGLKPESAIKLQALISEIISQQIWIPTEDFPEMKAKVSLDYLDNDRVIYDQQH